MVGWLAGKWQAWRERREMRGAVVLFFDSTNGEVLYTSYEQVQSRLGDLPYKPCVVRPGYFVPGDVVLQCLPDSEVTK